MTKGDAISEFINPFQLQGWTVLFCLLTHCLFHTQYVRCQLIQHVATKGRKHQYTYTSILTLLDAES